LLKFRGKSSHSCPDWFLIIFFSETAEQISTKLARNVHWMVLYQICVFGADLNSNMAARVHNVFSLAEFFMPLYFTAFLGKIFHIKNLLIKKNINIFRVK
jgi:hypothetical protein